MNQTTVFFRTERVSKQKRRSAEDVKSLQPIHLGLEQYLVFSWFAILKRITSSEYFERKINNENVSKMHFPLIEVQ